MQNCNERMICKECPLKNKPCYDTLTKLKVRDLQFKTVCYQLTLPTSVKSVSYHEFKKIQGTEPTLFNYLAHFRTGSQQECVLGNRILSGAQVFSQDLL